MIRRILLTGIILLNTIFGTVTAQEVTTELQQQLELQAEKNDAGTEDDGFLLDLDRFRKSPLLLNTATEEELQGLVMLSALQIAQLLRYRQVLGKLISIYELQAVPGWDPDIIRQLMPYCRVNNDQPLTERLKSRLKGGNSLVVLRVVHASAKDGGDAFLGNPFRVSFRYRYTYKNLLQYGILGDKDAGESFLRGAQRAGFDFYSVHYFARNIGALHAFALGDFTINMGQGLIQWQSLSFGKGADMVSLKHQSPVLKPYNSSGEYNFQRGVGATVVLNNLEWTFFGSLRKLDANLDTLEGNNAITSFLTSGLHRSAAESAKKGNVSQFSSGTTCTVRYKPGHVSANFIYYQFSLPIQKSAQPYNLYSIAGNKWFNGSVDFAWTIRNLHFFGEYALDRHLKPAFIGGMLASVSGGVDIGVVVRRISPAYRAVQASAFTENTSVENERAVYWGISVRPSSAVTLSGYIDFFQFPWLKYGVDGPSGGRDWQLQLLYKPSRTASLLIRFRSKLKDANKLVAASKMNDLQSGGRKSLRIHAELQAGKRMLLRFRTEWGILVEDNGSGSNTNVFSEAEESGGAEGWLVYGDITWKSKRSGWSCSTRITGFDTEDYATRIYAYETDLKYGYGMTALWGQGIKLYSVIGKNINKKNNISVRYAVTRQLEGFGKPFSWSGDWRIQLIRTL